MQTFSKHRKDSNKDRISNLPFELLCKILSFLESREVVRTCILSSKWRYVWASVPAIHLNSSSFRQAGHDRASVFEQFCNNLLLRRESVDLDTFRHSLPYGHGFASVKTWITDAVKFNPRVVDIDLWCSGDEHLPDCIFVCGTLEELKCKSSNAPKFVNLPRLRVLEIHRATFSDNFMSKLNSGCPMLEDLTLKNCDLYICEISLGTLRKFTMERCNCRNKMRISLPALVYLCLDWCTMEKLGLINLSSLVSTTIRYCSGFSAFVKLLGGPSNFKDLSLYGPDVMVWLIFITNVKDLSLYGPDVMDILKRGLQNWPNFDNLKSLSLGECECPKKDVHILTSFLDLLPNLEKLAFENIMWLSRKSRKRAENQRGPMAFYCEQLKNVSIKCSKDDGSDQLVRALLVYAENSMKIDVSVSQ